ncbi:MAG: WD40 repeat domain-containing protein [Saprospiraceae bacterium]|nr:WD40 repeat domain-containing protein [Saprospiraceae bacterium]
MCKQIIILILLLVPLLGTAQVISNKLYYTQTSEKSVTELDVSDFDQYIPVEDGNKLPEINEGNLFVMIGFDRSFQTSKISFEINSNHYSSFSAFPYLHSRQPTDNVVVIDISQWLNPGKNSFMLSYLGDQGVESNIWVFNILSGYDPSDIASQIKALPETDDPNKEYFLALSPSDPLIAYLSAKDDDINIFIQNLESGTRHRVTKIEKEESVDDLDFLSDDTEDYVSAPVWSNRGEYLYYCNRKNNDYSIRRLLVDGKGVFSETNNKELTINNTDKKQWIYALCHSPAHDRLVYVSKPGYMDKKEDDPKYVWLVRDLDEIDAENPAPGFMDKNRRKEFYLSGNNIYELAISADGNKLALTEENKQNGNTIYIFDLDSGKKLDTIKEDNKQFSFLEWSPQGDYLIFSSKNEVYLYSFADRTYNSIISDQKLAKTGFNTKPAWDGSGKAVFYICDDQNSSIKKLSFNDNMKPDLHPKDFINDSDYNFNNLISVDSGGRHLVFLNSGITYKLNYKKLRDKPQGVCRFKVGKNIQLAFKNRDDIYNWKMIAFQPDIKLASAFLEKTDVPSGNLQLRFNKIDQTSSIMGGLATDIRTDLKPDPDFALRFPIVGQHFQKRIRYRNYHFLTILAAGLTYGAGSFLEGIHYDEYKNISTRDQKLFEERSNTAMYIQFDNAQVENIGAMGLIALIDASYIQKKPDKNDITKHRENFINQKTVHSADSIEPMKNIKNAGYGQIKINCYEPYTEIRYKKYDNSGWTYVGRSNFIMDPDTYFTISDLPEGKYEVKFSAEFKDDKTYSVFVEEYKNRYVYNRFSNRSGSFIKKLPAFIPGLQQFKRKQYVKSLAYIGLTAYSGWQFYINKSAADDAYDDYNYAVSQQHILMARIDEREHTGKAVSYGIMFSFNYFNNLLDVFLKQ